MAVLRACTVCGALSDEKRCETHRVDTRPPARVRGYDAAWRRIRRRFLRSHPVCATEGCNRPATHVDHIDGRGPRGDNRPENLQGLCHSCHSRKTALHDGGFGHERTPR